MKFNKANTIKNPLRSLLAAVCAWAILVSLVLPVIATEVPETTPETTAETTAATEEATEATIPPTTTVITPVTTAETKGNSGLEEALRAEIAAYNDRNGISPEMPDSALANAYFALDSDGAKAAWEDAHGIIDRGANLTDAEADTLLGETNTKLFLRFYDVMQRINTPVMAAISGSENLQEGLTATGGSTFNWTVSASTISVKATPSSSSGCGGTSYSKQEDTLTLTIADGYTLKLTPTFSGQGTVTINSITPQSGSEYVYPAGTVTVTIASGSSEGADESLTLAYNCNSTSSSELEVLFNPVNGIPYTVNGEKVETEAVTVKALPADGYTINATSSSYGFSHGIFVDAAGTSTTMVASGGKLYPKTNGTITPFFGNDVDKDGVAPYLVDSAPYWDWEVAKNAAANGGKLIILNDDHTLSSGNYEIPSGITFLVPFDSSNTLITNNMGSYIATSSDTKTLFRQLTMSSGANLTVNGTLCVGSKAYRQMTGQVGPYGAIVMNSGSTITIGSGATMYAYGYIFSGDGSGTVSVEPGGTVYEDLMVMDYPGSADKTWTLYNEHGIFPMRAFTARNVEVPMTIKYGATEYVFYHFYGTNPFVGNNPGYALLIGETSEDNPCPFSLKEGATLTKSYSAGKQVVTISGDCSINAISIMLKKSYPVASSSTTGFPIPSGFDITFDNGTVTLGDNVIMTEGSKITIGKDATVNTNGKNLYVFAKNEAGAVSATDVHGTTYGKVDADAILDVNGTLNVSGGLYISADGSSIISSKETGTVNIQNTISQTKVKIKTGQSAATEYDVYPAKLLNGDASRVDIATSGVGAYKYVGTGTAGKWHKDCDGTTDATNITLPTYTTPGEQTVKCQCGLISEKQSIPKVVQLAAFAASAAEEIILDLKVNVPDTVTKLTVEQECLDNQVLITETKNYTIDVSEKTVTPDDSSDTSVPYFDKTTGRLIVSRGVASGEMTLPVELSFQDKDNNPVLFRPSGISKVSELEGSLSRTVVDYAELVLEQDENITDTQKLEKIRKQKNLITYLLTYGGYAQTYYNVDKDNKAYELLNKFGISLPDVTTVTTDTITQELTPSGDSIGITATETQQTFLDSAIYHRVYFTLDSGSNINNYTFKQGFPVNNKDAYQIQLTPQPDADRYYVDIMKIPAAYLDYMYTITVTNNSTGGTYTVKTSVLAYLDKLLEKSTVQDQQNMAKAMYLYNQAANTYFGK